MTLRRSFQITAALGALVLTSGGCSDGDGATSDRCAPATRIKNVWPPMPNLPGLPGTSPTPGAVSGAAAGGLTRVDGFGDNPGGLAMYVHTPPSLKAGAAVVVALHGCTQTAAAYANAGWNELADKHGFLIVYAEQSTSNDMQRCFRWFEPAHTTRDKGEAKSIRAMVDAARAQYHVNDAFVTGLSAGGAMTAVMLATYPDVFRAGAIMSGLPYHCAQSRNDAYTCMGGKPLSAAQLRALLPSDAQKNPPRVSIWHGDADYIVRSSNADELVDQWTAAHGLGDVPNATDTVGDATHDVYRDAKGVARVERWTVKGMGHGVPLDPKRGCGTAGAYMLDEGICAAAKAAEFFGVVGGGGANGASAGARPGECDE